MPYRIAFAAVPPVGTVLHWDAQLFSLTAVEPYTRRDGRSSIVLTWTAECATCHRLFTTTTGLRGHIDCRRCARCIKLRRSRAVRSSKFRPRGWKGPRS